MTGSISSILFSTAGWAKTPEKKRIAKMIVLCIIYSEVSVEERCCHYELWLYYKSYELWVAELM